MRSSARPRPGTSPSATTRPEAPSAPAPLPARAARGAPPARPRPGRRGGAPADTPAVIGGEDVATGTTRPAVMPHDKEHVLADVHQAGPEQVEQAINVAAAAWEDW